MSYADPSDVAVELGRASDSVSDEEAAQWQAWLDRVERSIERGFRRQGLVLSTQVAAGDPTIDDVRDVEVARVVDKVNNPRRLTSITRTVDDASITERDESGTDDDALDLTNADWKTLLPSTPNQARAFSIMPS